VSKKWVKYNVNITRRKQKLTILEARKRVAWEFTKETIFS